jgi:hypothetical protein
LAERLEAPFLQEPAQTEVVSEVLAEIAFEAVSAAAAVFHTLEPKVSTQAVQVSVREPIPEEVSVSAKKQSRRPLASAPQSKESP